MHLPLPQFATKERHPNHIAEVIETASTEFLAQCLDPDELSFPVMPPFGSWVKSTDIDTGNQIFAVIYHATTTPIDSIHRARALGMSLEELREQQPQIFAMLKTEFRAAIAGFSTGTNPASSNKSKSQKGNGSAPIPTKIYQYLPPRPPQIHQAVYRCEPEEIIAFTEELDFLRSLLQLVSAPVDALTAATIREAYILRKGDREWLVKAGRTLGLVLKDDYDRLRYILSQLHF
ncbi:hypothetical protein [Merismopedia glauca]|uniref:Helicase HerA barrel domain-containing protein n=1 Tax=Merismopedia glauca CCAP 1448/3 TaxID=1296344 RepID=A0A2T1C1V6_9CYAN|nr:hypothetical protein [Merismopedia glauca]PSB02256.1 hypothetical protein C7B64_14090 [Merismopedia glauca CCAP 1448/3]